MKKLALMFFVLMASIAYGQGSYPIRAEKIYFIDTAGDTAATFDVATGKFGFGTVNPRGSLTITEPETGVAAITFFSETNTSIFKSQKNDFTDTGRSIAFITETTAGDSSNNAALFIDKVAGNVGINTNTPSQQLDVNGYVKRRDVINLDAISFYPPLDSGAVLTVLNNSIETLQFYHNTDSIYAYNTIQLNPWETQVDSIQLFFIVPNYTGDDSVAFEISYRNIGFNEVSNKAFTVLDTTYLKLALSLSYGVGNIISMSWTTGLSGEVANDIIDIRLKRINAHTKNPAFPVSIRRLRIFKQ